MTESVRAARGGNGADGADVARISAHDGVDSTVPPLVSVVGWRWVFPVWPRVHSLASRRFASGGLQARRRSSRDSIADGRRALVVGLMWARRSSRATGSTCRVRERARSRILGSWYAFGSGTLVRATPLILTGLAVAFAFRAGVFNIGAEGQFVVGAAASDGGGAGLRAPARVRLDSVGARRRQRCGWRVGRDRRDASRALSRARSHQHDHAQLRRGGFGLVSRARADAGAHARLPANVDDCRDRAASASRRVDAPACWLSHRVSRHAWSRGGSCASPRRGFRLRGSGANPDRRALGGTDRRRPCRRRARSWRAAH